MSLRLSTPLTLAATFLLFAACGNTAGGGGTAAQNVGGPVGSVCNPDFHNQGCTAGKKVQCDTGTKQWTEIAACVTGEFCAEKADPADTTGVKKLASCDKQPVYNQPDTVGDGTTNTTDGGGTTTKTPAEMATCLQQKCATEYAACMAVPACKAAFECGAKCQDEACQQACPTIPLENEAASKAAFGAFACGQSQGCAPSNTVPKPTCGDGNCDDGETPVSCAADCKKTTGPECGNGQCETGETPSTCAADCEPEGPKCGNGKCESGETSSTCPSDCKASTVCGDLKCQSPENASTCLIDCDEQYAGEVACAKSKCASQYAACASKPGCLDALNCSAKCEKNDQGSACAQKCLAAAGSASSALIALDQCAAQQCADGPPPCTSSSQCSSGQQCVAGKCVTDTQPECSASKPCASGKKCVAGKCVTDGGGTSCVGKCGKFDDKASCQCDDQCTQYKDCCPDYTTVCPKTP